MCISVDQRIHHGCVTCLNPRSHHLTVMSISSTHNSTYNLGINSTNVVVVVSFLYDI